MRKLGDPSDPRVSDFRNFMNRVTLETPALLDEISMMLQHIGGRSPALDRLSKVAMDMQQLEWIIARRTAAGLEGGRVTAE
jgi:hypothetical protein